MSFTGTLALQEQNAMIHILQMNAGTLALTQQPDSVRIKGVNNSLTRFQATEPNNLPRRNELFSLTKIRVCRDKLGD